MKLTKLKLVLSIVMLLTLIVAAHVYAYGALTVCLRSYSLGVNYAGGNVGSFGLRNGTWNLYARVNYGISRAGSYGSNVVFAGVSDMGSSSQSGVANAYVGGHDSAGIYQSDSDSDSN